MNTFNDVPPPDESWDAEQLGHYAHQQDEQMKLAERKLAIHAYRLGQALIWAKSKMPHGEWGKYRKKHGVSHTRWIHAKQLVERATEEELLKLGLTEAYLRYGILNQPAIPKDDPDDDDAKEGGKKKAATHKGKKPSPTNDDEEDEQIESQGDDVEDDDADSNDDGEQDDDGLSLVTGPWKLPRFAQENDGKDEFYTPDAATAMLLPYLPKGKVIWESAWGAGHIARYLQSQGHTVVGGPDVDFLKENVEASILITNPPYSKKDEFLLRAYEIGKPFAMLLAADTLVGLERYPLFSKHGIQLLIPNKRINFICAADSSAFFNAIWYCWKLLPQDIVFAELPLTPNGQGGVE